MITYTTILHQAREELGLSLNEYALADIIYHLQNNLPSNETHLDNYAQPYQKIIYWEWEKKKLRKTLFIKRIPEPEHWNICTYWTARI